MPAPVAVSQRAKVNIIYIVFIRLLPLLASCCAAGVRSKASQGGSTPAVDIEPPGAKAELQRYAP
jgi:hypothetical protein